MKDSSSALTGRPDSLILCQLSAVKISIKVDVEEEHLPTDRTWPVEAWADGCQQSRSRLRFLVL